MKNKFSGLSGLVQEMDLPEDVCKGGYHIELFNNTVVVDGCKNVAEYGAEKIRLNTGRNQIGICGSGLTIKSFSCSQVTVTGTIICVEVA